MTTHPQVQPNSEGYNEAERHASSLLQQALWIEESVDGTVSPSMRVDLGDVDTDELRSSAHLIMWQAVRAEQDAKRIEELEKLVDGHKVI